MPLKLRPYQREGASFLVLNETAMLGDEMRLGKTIQTAVAAQFLDARRTLIVCPAIARYNWQRELRKWAPAICLPPPGAFDSGGPFVLEKLNAPIPPSAAIIVSYEFARSQIERLARYDWDLLVLDESHKLSNLGAQQTANIMDFALRHCKRVWELTGTPIRKHPGDLWRWAVFAGLTKLTYHEWVTRYCDSKFIGRDVKVFGAKAAAVPELRKLLKDSGRFLRRRQSEVGMQMPKVTYAEYTVPNRLPTREEEEAAFSTLSHDQLWSKITREKGKLEAELAKHAIGEQTRMTDEDLAFLESLAQSVSTLRRYCAMVKVKSVIELLLEEISAEPKRKFFVLAEHKIFIESVWDVLKAKGHKVVKIYGGTEPKKRDVNLEIFQTDPKCRVLVGNTLACGTAVSMSAATDVLVGEAPWVVADLRQAVARALGPMQKNAVLVRFVTLADSVDAAVMRVLMRRASDVDAILDGADPLARNADADLSKLLGE